MVHDWKKWKAEYDESWVEYQTMWQIWNDVLYEMCQRYPKHKRKKEIAAKVGLIGRSYMSGIERHSKKTIFGIIEFFHKHGSEIDDLFASLRSLKEPLTIEKLQLIVAVHGKFLSILRKMTRDRNTLRSFAAKYMHFHCSAVPIFDNIANNVIKQRGWYPLTDARIPRFAKPRYADDIYHDFCVRFFSLYCDLKRSGFKVDVRRLDHYLLWNQ